MTEQDPRGQDLSAKDSLALALKTFDGILKELDALIEEMEAKPEGAAAKAKASAADLRRSILIVFEEKKRVEKLRNDESGGDGLDLAAARAEVGRRLARLQDADRADGFPDGAGG